LPEYTPANVNADAASIAGSSPGNEATGHTMNHTVMAIRDPLPGANYLEVWWQETDIWLFLDEKYGPAYKVYPPLVDPIPVGDPVADPGLLLAPSGDDAAVDVGPELPELAGLQGLRGLADETVLPWADEIIPEVEDAMATQSRNNPDALVLDHEQD